MTCVHILGVMEVVYCSKHFSMHCVGALAASLTSLNHR